MKDFSIAMALVDFIPVILFGIGSVLLQRDLYNKMSKGAFALLSAGTINIFMAGALKACYKLLYATGACDFEPLNAMFFPVQSLGFLLTGIGIISMIYFKQGNGVVTLSTAPLLYKGTFLFVSLMVIGLGLMDAGLIILGKRLKKPLIGIFFVISFLCSLGMGYLSTKDFTKSSMNWIAEGVNIVGQGCFLAGAFALHKAGLEEYKIPRK